jgi:hypothetical protein
MIYANGYEYTGGFLNETFHNEGELLFPNGIKFVATFVNGKI